MSQVRYVGTKGRMSEAHEERITRNMKFIKSEIDVLDLLDSLISAFTITREDAQLVRSCGTKKDMNQRFIDIILHRGPNAYRNFIAALNENGYPHVSKVLDAEAEEDTGLISTGMFSSTLNEIKQIQNSVNILEKSLGNMKDKISGLSHRSPAKSSLQNIAKELHTVETVIKQKDQEIVSLKEELGAKDDKIRELMRELKGRGDRLQEAHEMIDALKSKVADLENLCREQRREIAQLSETVTCHENEIKMQSNTMSKHQRKIEQQRESIEGLTTTVNSQNVVIEKQKKDVSELRRNSLTQETKMRSLESDNKEHKLMLTRQQNLLDCQADKLQKQQVTLDAQGKRLSSLSEEVQQKGLKMEQHGERLMAQSKVIEDQRQHIKSQDQQICQQQKSLNSQKYKIGHLEKVVEKQEQQLATQESAIQQQGGELKAVKEALAEIRMEQRNMKPEDDSANIRNKQKFVNRKWNW